MNNTQNNKIIINNNINNNIRKIVFEKDFNDNSKIEKRLDIYINNILNDDKSPKTIKKRYIKEIYSQRDFILKNKSQYSNNTFKEENYTYII